MTTTDKNAEIARWMGAIETSNETYPALFLPIKDSDEWFAPDELKYHSDWRWVHKVIDKIDELLPDDSFVTIEYKDCYIPVLDDENPFTIQVNAPTKIEAVHEAVYQFVVWHNAQVNKNPKP
jgi:hypothetical protein